MRHTAKAPVLFCDDGDTEVELPSRWEICCSCDGEGTTSRHVECDGGGFTASEWAEEDDDFREDYMAGAYDSACDECGGSGKVKVADRERMSAEENKAYDEQLQADAEFRAEQAAERRMGCW